MDEAAEAVVLGADGFHDGGDIVAISELHTRSGSVGEQFLSEGPGEAVFVLQQHGFILRHIRKGASVRHRVACFDSVAAMDSLFAWQDLDDLAGAGRDTIKIAPAANDIEGLQRKARWIDHAVAAHAGGRIAMSIELFTDGRGTTDVGLDRSCIRRRWRWVDAEDSFIDPVPANDG